MTRILTALAAILLQAIPPFPTPKPPTVPLLYETAPNMRVYRSLPSATYGDEVKNGEYVATFRDPNNKWRCIVSSTSGTGPVINAFTIVCSEPQIVPVNNDKISKP